MSQAIHYTNSKDDVPDEAVNLPIKLSVQAGLSQYDKDAQNQSLASKNLNNKNLNHKSDEAILDKETILDKKALLTALGEACRFPDDYVNHWANNWDSAWDCLTDSNLNNGADRLQLDIRQISHINNEDFNAFKTLIEDAYAEYGKPQLWVIGA